MLTMGEPLQPPTSAVTMPSPSGGSFPQMDELLTIEDVARRLGMSVATVRLRVAQRHFHPIKVKNRLMFHPSQVDAELNRVETIRRERLGKILDTTSPPKFVANQGLPKNLPEPVIDKKGKAKPPEPSPKSTDSVQVGSLIYNGQQCATAVKLFREGKEVLDVIAEMEITFEIAKHFWKQYLDLQPVWVLPNKQFAQLRILLDWDEDPATPDGLMKAVRAHIDKVVEREVAAKVRREIGEEVSPEEKAELDRLDAELAAQAARKAAAKASEEKKP